ncbi:MAG TPA: hypothetical protein VM451_11345 [Candidatus Limnocylindria bacterium]|nr:hypothetical protein [Candidatus Limnocylindria bacterium]
MRPRIRSLAVLSITLLLAACGGGGSATAAPTGGGGGATTPAGTASTATQAAGDVCARSDAAATVVNAVVGNAWDPATINAKVGDVLQWANGDGVPHGVELDGGPKCTGSIPGGGTGATSFTVAGTYPFHCFVHASMKGTFVIS